MAVAVQPLDPELTAPPTSAQGSFGVAEPCDDPRDRDPAAPTVCVPGGAFLLGSRGQTIFLRDDNAATPERIALMSRFWMDRHEVTVARVRDAAARGFVVDRELVIANEKPIAQSNKNAGELCTYSASAMGREDLPVTCIAWQLARAFCRFEGGDLPTEAQWEYAALAAGRRAKALYPWGDDAPTCDRARFGIGNRFSEPGHSCPRTSDRGAEAGPSPVTAHDGHDGRPGDVNALGLVDLAGNVVEWVRDAAASYTSLCWASASLRDPHCDDENAPYRTARGFGWAFEPVTLASRYLLPPSIGHSDPVFVPLVDTGFRCVYPTRRTR